MSNPPATSVPARHSVISPVVDLLCVGGLSLLFFVPLLLSGRRDLVLVGVGAQAWLATLINMPHFMASYRLVYRSRESILRHRWASIYVPAILLVYIAHRALGSAVLVVDGGRSGVGVERVSRVALHRPGVGHDGVVLVSRGRIIREARAVPHSHGSANSPRVAS